MIAAIDLPDHSGRTCYLTTPQMEWISRYGVMTATCIFRQTSHGIVLGSSTSRSEFTVISRNLR